MALKQEYFDLLEHIGKTSTIISLHQSTEGDHVVALRHDVDHDLDLALEMAHHEWRLGYRATYYLLHTEDYWNDPDFALKVKQLSEYGHEIGLHVNSFSSWYMNLCNDPNLEIEQALARLRSCGIEVKGVCAHGDKLCYQHQFVNYWMWKELRGENPEITEEGISAEGIRVEDEAYKIPYPKTHSLQRDDGSIAKLWDLSMQESGIEYDAAHLQSDHYWTDSGGTWSRSGSPLKHNFSAGTHQVLVHPWWWRGETKTIFIMSSARSGSKWLANYIDKATSAVGLHEWTLNHTRDGNEFPLDNRTSREFPQLLEHPEEIASRLKAAKSHHRLLNRDVIECNVYLEGCLEEFRNIFSDSIVLHLKRDEKEVVRSILNRGWYAVTKDCLHRTDGRKSWLHASQLERACRYVQSANNSIDSVSEGDVCFQEMTNNPNFLPEFFAKHQIVVHPMLAQELFSERINKNNHEPIPPVCSWQESILDPVVNFFNSEQGEEQFQKVSTPKEFATTKSVTWRKCQVRGATINKKLRKVIMNGSPNAKASICFFDSTWNKNNKAGIQVEQNKEYNIHLTVDNQYEIHARVFVLCFDREGEIINRTHLSSIEPNLCDVQFLYKPDPQSSTFSIAVLVEEQLEEWKLRFKKISVTQRTQPKHYNAYSLFGICSLPAP